MPRAEPRQNRARRSSTSTAAPARCQGYLLERFPGRSWRINASSPRGQAEVETELSTHRQQPGRVRELSIWAVHRHGEVGAVRIQPRPCRAFEEETHCNYQAADIVHGGCSRVGQDSGTDRMCVITESPTHDGGGRRRRKGLADHTRGIVVRRVVGTTVVTVPLAAVQPGSHEEKRRRSWSLPSLEPSPTVGDRPQPPSGCRPAEAPVQRGSGQVQGLRPRPGAVTTVPRRPALGLILVRGDSHGKSPEGPHRPGELSI